MMKATVTAALIPLMACLLLGQKKEAPAFEVASVKPSRVENTSWSVGCSHPQSDPNIPSGRCQAKNAPLRRIIADAYELPYQLTDQYLLQVPGWVSTERYDIDAKAENS